MTARNWSFVEDDPDGAVWFGAPDKIWSMVDGTDTLDGKRYRIMVATRRWLQGQVDELGSTATSSFFASMLIVRDGTRDELLRALDSALARGGLSMFGKPL